jgi:hypothetical protein
MQLTLCEGNYNYICTCHNLFLSYFSNSSFIFQNKNQKYIFRGNSKHNSCEKDAKAPRKWSEIGWGGSKIQRLKLKVYF